MTQRNKILRIKRIALRKSRSQRKLQLYVHKMRLFAEECTELWTASVLKTLAPVVKAFNTLFQ